MLPNRKRRQTAIACLLAAAGLLAVAEAGAHVYFGWGEDGEPVYTDRPLPGFVLFLDGAEPPSYPGSQRQTSQGHRAAMRKYSAQIAAIAAEQGLAPELLHAVVQVESGYDASAVSPKGAVGLMQLMPSTARRLGVQERTDALANLRGGARYLRELLALFGGDLMLALAAYNAGPAAVERHARRIPPFPETISYVQEVMRRFELLTNRR